LTSVTIPDSVTSIGVGAFDCTGLTSIVVDANNAVYSSQDGVLYNKAMTVLIQYPVGKSGGFTIPNSVKSIGVNAFASCSGLTSVTIGNSVTNIGDFAFYDCTGLTSVTIPDSVTSIGDSAFESCDGLTSVTIGNSVTSIGDSAFDWCNGLTSVIFQTPSNVTSIGDEAFQDCKHLTSVTIGNSVTNIGDSAFYDCGSLTSVTIGNSVTNIGYFAFYDCTGLTSVTIPDSVTSIGDFAFESCGSLTKAYFLGNAPSMGMEVFDGCASNFSVCYTAGSTWFTSPTWDGYPAAVCNQCVAKTLYGEGSEETELLREYRDKVLSKSATGRQMIKTYYELSPAVSEVLQKNDIARTNARKVLDTFMPAIRVRVKQ